MAAATGRPVRFEDQTEEEAFASRATLGAPAFAVRGWVSSYLAVREGLMARVSPHVRELTGREPVGLDAYLRARPDALDHVGAGDRAS
jgi:hypothetical protein